jgi:hypothetical protein
MTRAELIKQQSARDATMHCAFWVLGLGAVGIKIAIPSLSDVWPYLATATGNEWLVPLIAGYFAISSWHNLRMPKCPHCHRALNGPIAVATDRCGRCGEIAVDDPRMTNDIGAATTKR